jgi:glycosyltransferase involved in cell wall biosynthesis
MVLVMTDAGKMVSVVVPTRDRPELLREALESIRALERDGVSFEIIVGDNGTSKETRQIVEAFKAVYLHTSKQGSAAARNIAMRAATADYLAFLDDDDLWTSNHIHEHLKLLVANPDIDMVVGQIINTDAQRCSIYGPWPKRVPEGRQLIRLMLSGYFPQIGATVVRTRVREAIGFFNEELIGGQDWDWQLRVARTHRVGFVEHPCVLFRQRAAGTYDELQLKRITFARRIFFSHALPEWRLWESPLAFARSYFGVMEQFLTYFTGTALYHVNKGERLAALVAIWRGFAVFPSRALRMLLSQSSLRSAFVAAIKGVKVDRVSTRSSE